MLICLKRGRIMVFRILNESHIDIMVYRIASSVEKWYAQIDLLDVQMSRECMYFNCIKNELSN